METKSPTPLAGHLGFWLRYVSNHVSGSFAGLLAEEEVSVAEWVALRELYDGELAPSLLADRLGMTRGAITKLAARLLHRKFMHRRADTSDGRSQLLALTPLGRTLVPKLSALADRNDADYFAFLGKAERVRLEKTLKEIVRRHDLKHVPVN